MLAEEAPEEAPEPTAVKEITRLAVIVHTIDTECAMAPQGALAKMSSGSVNNNANFSGFGAAAALKLSSYVLINKGNVSCDSITPACALVGSLDEALNVVSFRSLLYPGFLSYHMVGSPIWGYSYFGSGEKNADLAFMLP